jgi:hypothetical protein
MVSEMLEGRDYERTKANIVGYVIQSLFYLYFSHLHYLYNICTNSFTMGLIIFVGNISWGKQSGRVHFAK